MTPQELVARCTERVEQATLRGGLDYELCAIAVIAECLHILSVDDDFKREVIAYAHQRLPKPSQKITIKRLNP
jgi:hypothetical protein